MLSCKSLPIKYPDITSYPYYANIFSVISTTSEDSTSWMLSHFIQLFCHLENQSLKLDYFQPWVTWVPEFCPFLNVQVLNKSLVEKFINQNILSFVKQIIDINHYLVLFVNHKYIKFSKSYLKYDHVHELFIYGYDYVNEKLKVADNFNGKYEFIEMTYEEFNEAYYKTPQRTDTDIDKIYVLETKSNVNYEFDLLKVVDSIKDYITSKDTRIRDEFSMNWAGKLTVGIKIYDKILEYLFQLANNKSNFDRRLFHVLWEHKTLMVKRIMLMQHKKILLNNRIEILYRELEQNSLKLRNMMLKYSLTKDNKIIYKVIKEIEKYPEYEINLLNELIAELYINENYIRKNTIILGNSQSLKLTWTLI